MFARVRKSALLRAIAGSCLIVSVLTLAVLLIFHPNSMALGDEESIEQSYELTYRYEFTDSSVMRVGYNDMDLTADATFDADQNQITIIDPIPEGYRYASARTLEPECPENSVDCENITAWHNIQSETNNRIVAKNLCADCSISVEVTLKQTAELSYRVINLDAFAGYYDPIMVPESKSYDVGDTITVAPAIPTNNSNIAFYGWFDAEGNAAGDSIEIPEGGVELTGYFANATNSKTLTWNWPSGCAQSEDVTTEQVYVATPIDLSYGVGRICVIDGVYKRISGWTTPSGNYAYNYYDTNHRYLSMPNFNLTLSPALETMPQHTVSYALKTNLAPEGYTLPTTAQYYETQPVSLEPVPTAPEGWRFLGWYHDDNFEMSTEDIVIEGEWERYNGEFAPTVDIELANHDDPTEAYLFAETVEFTVTVTNEQNFAINNVVIQHNFDGMTMNLTNGQTPIGTDRIQIDSIPANSSATINLSWQNEYDSSDNYSVTVNLESAEPSEDYYFLAEPHSQDSVDFRTLSTEDTPYTFLGTSTPGKSNAVVKTVTTSVSAVIAFAAILFALRRRTNPVVRFALVGVVAFCMTFAAANLLQGDFDGYAEDEVLAEDVALASTTDGIDWQIDSTYIPRSSSRAALQLDLSSKAIYTDASEDVVFVIDSSDSYTKDSWETLKTSVVESAQRIINNDGRVALIDFNEEARTDLSFTSNLETFKIKLGGIARHHSANYSNAYAELLTLINNNDSSNLKAVFITDGYNTDESGAEKSLYAKIKAQKPNAQIFAVQYEMGMMAPVAVAEISDAQYAANAENLAETLEDIVRNRRSFDNFEIRVRVAEGVEVKGDYARNGKDLVIPFAASYVSGETRAITLELIGDKLSEDAIEQISVTAELDNYREDIVSSARPQAPQFLLEDVTLDTDEEDNISRSK